MNYFGGNSGYNGYSESIRSLEAKREGRYPKAAFMKAYGFSASVFTLIKEAASTGEWHHTSMYGNKTSFFSITDRVIEILETIGGEERFPQAYEQWMNDYEKECEPITNDQPKKVIFPFEYKFQPFVKPYSIEEKLSFLSILLSDGEPYSWTTKKGDTITVSMKDGKVNAIRNNGDDAFQALISLLHSK